MELPRPSLGLKWGKNPKTPKFVSIREGKDRGDPRRDKFDSDGKFGVNFRNFRARAEQGAVATPKVPNLSSDGKFGMNSGVLEPDLSTENPLGPEL